MNRLAKEAIRRRRRLTGAAAVLAWTTGVIAAFTIVATYAAGGPDYWLFRHLVTGISVGCVAMAICLWQAWRAHQQMWGHRLKVLEVIPGDARPAAAKLRPAVSGDPHDREPEVVSRLVPPPIPAYARRVLTPVTVRVATPTPVHAATDAGDADVLAMADATGITTRSPVGSDR